MYPIVDFRDVCVRILFIYPPPKYAKSYNGFVGFYVTRFAISSYIILLVLGAPMYHFVTLYCYKRFDINF